jgi:hypothetical protein
VCVAFSNRFASDALLVVSGAAGETTVLEVAGVAATSGCVCTSLPSVASVRLRHNSSIEAAGDPATGRRENGQGREIRVAAFSIDAAEDLYELRALLEGRATSLVSRDSPMMTRASSSARLHFSESPVIEAMRSSPLSATRSGT